MNPHVAVTEDVRDMPGTLSRAAGILWLACIVTSVISFVAGIQPAARVTAPDTAAIAADASLFRLAITADVLSGLTYLGATAVLYHLLRPAGRSTSFAAAVFGIGGIAIGGIAFVSHLAPVVLLSGDQYLSAFTPAQLQAGALLALKLRIYIADIGMMFFGVQIVLVGYLIARSEFLPRALGIMMMLGGSTYVVAAVASLLVPTVGNSLMRVAMVAALIVEGSATLWLLLKGVDAQRWRERYS